MNFYLLPHLQSPLSPLHPCRDSAPCGWLEVLILTLPSTRSSGLHLVGFPSWRARQSQTRARWLNCRRSKRVTMAHMCVWFALGTVIIPFFPSMWMWLLMVSDFFLVLLIVGMGFNSRHSSCSVIYSSILYPQFFKVFTFINHFQKSTVDLHTFILLRTLCSSHLCILHPPPPTSCFLASLLSTVNSVASFTNLTHGEWLCNRAVWNSCVSSLLIRRSRMPGQLSTSEHNPYCCRNFSFQFTLSYYSVLSLCLQLTLHPASFSSDFPVELLACTVLLFLHFCFFVLCLSDFFFLTLWFLSCFLIVCRSFNLHCHSGTDILYSNLSWGPGGLCSAILAPSRLQEAEKYDADVPLWQVEGFHMGGS